LVADKQLSDQTAISVTLLTGKCEQEGPVANGPNQSRARCRDGRGRRINPIRTGRKHAGDTDLFAVGGAERIARYGARKADRRRTLGWTGVRVSVLGKRMWGVEKQKTRRSKCCNGPSCLKY
jgi:hypothetical protein